MKHVSMLSLMLILLIGLSTIAFLTPQPISSSPISPKAYVGISFCGNTTQQAQVLIDKTKAYTNLFVLQSGPISLNETATTEICDYAVSQGLNLIVYFGWFNPHYPWQYPWVKNATQKYGDKFLGVYYYDEPGGIQLDYDWTGHFLNVSKRFSDGSISRNYTGYYRYFIDSIKGYLNGTIRDYDVEAKAYMNYMQHDRDMTRLKNISMRTFVSDYALYWWDYLGGYDVVLTQLGNNASLTQEIALTKGAARLQNKTWGAILTWKYDEPPYLDSGKEIYNQMQMAYQAGAKYIILFDYPQIGDNPYGVLTDEHFAALETFWKDTMLTPPSAFSHASNQASAVLVLPQNYGWGMRHVQDRIWIWGPDEKCPQIWDISRKLVAQYGASLDIVYEDPNFPVTGKYAHIYYWNQTLT
jgi:hypothetical protein